MRLSVNRKMANNKSVIRYENCQILIVSKRKLTVHFFFTNFNGNKLTISGKMAKNGHCLRQVRESLADR